MKMFIVQSVAILLAGCATRIEPQVTSPASLDMAELHNGETYYGEVILFAGGKASGYVTWDSLNSRYLLRPFTTRDLTVKLPFGDVAHFRFRELTPKEKRTLEDQNRTNGH